MEPARRGTASCVILALSVIKKRKLKDQPILFLWADHLIRDKQGFISSAKQAAKLAEAHQELVFLGVEPTYPSTGFGYIQKAKNRKMALRMYLNWLNLLKNQIKRRLSIILIAAIIYGTQGI